MSLTLSLILLIHIILVYNYVTKCPVIEIYTDKPPVCHFRLESVYGLVPRIGLEFLCLLCLCVLM